MAGIGVIKCKFYWPSNATQSYETSGLMLLDMQILGPDFFFYPTRPDSEPVLFMIVNEGPTDGFERVLDAYGAAYGGPKSEGVEQKQNGLGNVFNGRIARWQNRVSSAEIEQFGSSIRRFRITLTLTSVIEIVERRLHAQNQVNAGRL